jgi:hypothetical protein
MPMGFQRRGRDRLVRSLRAGNGLERLRDDLDSVRWHDPYGDPVDAEALDLGYWLVVPRRQ